MNQKIKTKIYDFNQKKHYSIPTNFKYITQAVPYVVKEFKFIEKQVENIPNTNLRNLAIDSIYEAKDNCICQSYFSIFDSNHLENMVKFTTSINIIATYIKNIILKNKIQKSDCVNSLFLALNDALSQEFVISEYYKNSQFSSDGGFLASLVNSCQVAISEFKNYKLIKPFFLEHIEKYSKYCTQVLFSTTPYDEAVIEFAMPLNDNIGLITCLEFAASCSNLLVISALLPWACRNDTDTGFIKDTLYAYFPWISGLYGILESYVNTNDERNEHFGNLNFCKRYANQKICENRIIYFYKMSCENINLMKRSEDDLKFLKLFTTRFLTDYRAHAGLNYISSKNIIKTSKINSPVYKSFFKIARTTGLLVNE